MIKSRKRIFLTGLLLVLALILPCVMLKNNKTFFANAEENNKINVVCVGDSLTQGIGADHKLNYPSYLQEYLGDNYNVAKGIKEDTLGTTNEEIYGFGVSGRTLSENGDKPYKATNMYTLSKAVTPDILVVMLGTNDTKSGNRDYISGLGQELNDLIDEYKLLNNNVKIIIATSPTVFLTGGGAGIDNTLVSQVVDIQKQVATTKNYDLVDINTFTKNLRSYAPDLLHFSNAGYKLIAQEISNQILGASVNDTISPSYDSGNWGKHTSDSFGLIGEEEEYLSFNNASNLKLALDVNQSISMKLSFDWDTTLNSSIGFSLLNKADTVNTYDPSIIGDSKGLMFRIYDYAGIKMDVHYKNPNIGSTVATYCFQTVVGNNKTPDGLIIPFGEKMNFEIKSVDNYFAIFVNGIMLTTDGKTNFLKANGLGDAVFYDDYGYTYLNMGAHNSASTARVNLFSIQNGEVKYSMSDVFAYGFNMNLPYKGTTDKQLNAYVNGKYYVPLNPDYISIDMSMQYTASGISMFGFSSEKAGDGYYGNYTQKGITVFLRSRTEGAALRVAYVDPSASPKVTEKDNYLSWTELYIADDTIFNVTLRVVSEDLGVKTYGLFVNGQMFVDTNGDNILVTYFNGGRDFINANGYTYFGYGAANAAAQATRTVIYSIKDATSLAEFAYTDIARIGNNPTLHDKERVEKARQSYQSLDEDTKLSISNYIILTNAESVLVDKQQKVDNMVGMISALNESVTYLDKDMVESAKQAFDLLSKDEQDFVFNKAELQEKFEIIEELVQEVNELGLKITSLPIFTDITIANKSEINLIKSEYDKLQDAQKQAVLNNQDLLNAVEKIIDLEVSAVVDVLIINIPAVLTYDDLYLVTLAKSEYDKLTDTQKSYLVKESELITAMSQAEVVLFDHNVDYVISQIALIPTTITLNSELYILSARFAYDDLTDEEKAVITNYNVLTNAESELIQLRANIDNVISKINAIGTVTLESESAITEARTAYDALTADEKVKVTNYETLTTAESTLTSLKESKSKVDNVISKINAIGTVTLESESAITEARTAYDALTADEKVKVTNYETLTTAETELKTLKENSNKKSGCGSMIESNTYVFIVLAVALVAVTLVLFLKGKKSKN